MTPWYLLEYFLTLPLPLGIMGAVQKLRVSCIAIKQENGTDSIKLLVLYIIELEIITENALAHRIATRLKG